MRLLASSLAMLLIATPAAAAEPIALTGEPYTQNFDRAAGEDVLPDNSDKGNWTNGQTVAGWHLIASNASEEPTDVDTLVRTNGSSTTGGFKNYASHHEAAQAPDRALGSVCNDTFPGKPEGTGFSPSLFTIVHFRNDTGKPITALRVQYTGEQWRIAADQDNLHDLRFDYAVKKPENLAARSGTKGWSDEVRQLRFAGPQANDADNSRTGAIDGNRDENRQALDHTIRNLKIEPGAEFYLRWRDLNNQGIDHGLAIDDVAISYTMAE
jgi:hypothetical protein